MSENKAQTVLGLTSWYQRLPGGTTRLWDRMDELSGLLVQDDNGDEIFAFLPVTEENLLLFQSLNEDQKVEYSDSRDVDDWLSTSDRPESRGKAMLYLKPNRLYHGYTLDKLVIDPALLSHFGIDRNTSQIVKVEHSVMATSMQVGRMNISVRVTPAGLEALNADVRKRLQAVMDKGHDVHVEADIKPDGLSLSFWTAERGRRVDSELISQATLPLDKLGEFIGFADQIDVLMHPELKT